MTRQRFQRLFDIIEWQWRRRAVRRLIIVVRARLFGHGSSWRAFLVWVKVRHPVQEPGRASDQACTLPHPSLYYRPTEKENDGVTRVGGCHAGLIQTQQELQHKTRPDCHARREVTEGSDAEHSDLIVPFKKGQKNRRVGTKKILLNKQTTVPRRTNT